ncbi:MAG TPA: sigma 54-interacting transcriptional regulator, partial [Thermoanaerobaculia bacterium]|nr:sigma 54-interacting transcriptional regulator [Thermoanaerobaculia bacterium]
MRALGTESVREAAATPAEPTTQQGTGFGPLETVFEALGRALIVLDVDFRILRASHTLDEIAGAGMVDAVLGRPIEELVGAKLFGPSDTLRESLTDGRREEGRRAVLRCGVAAARLVSLTAAPVPLHVSNHCDPRARYLVVVRPAEDEDALLQSMIASHGLVSRSPAMLRIVHVVESLHRSTATVLITGESGTGKEVLARAIHSHSLQSGGPFVAVNCGALPPDLLESELFGHVKGAFTGAVRDRTGRFDLARGGTVFLDEVGDIPLHLQVRLLRVLQERQFERVGESAPRPMTARVIAATNRDLTHAIREGRFREDLYYRLRVVPLHIPPLRERPEDVGVIAQHLLAHIGGRAGRAVRLSPDTLAAMERYAWPGNVRELENALEYAVALSSGQTIQIEDLPEEIRGGGAEHPASTLPAPVSTA